ncbi:phosphoribosylformylglycinamidine synthase subunit PurL [bacterium]|nr:phosphoribosylformylglycinamidine synthase subunit PurL [bacterium]
MLWAVEIHPASGEVDREGERVVLSARELGAATVTAVVASRLFLLEGELTEAQVSAAAAKLLVDPVAEQADIRPVLAEPSSPSAPDGVTIYVLFKPGVTDNTAESTRKTLLDLEFPVTAVATARAYRFPATTSAADVQRVTDKLLFNQAIERVMRDALRLRTLDVGHSYEFELKTVPLRAKSDGELVTYSETGTLHLSLAEMQTVQRYFVDLQRDPTDIELETIAQTWSEHCSHKTLKGRIRYRDEQGERHFENMLKETVFAATQTIRQTLGTDDWCVSVFQDNAGVVKFTDDYHACFKVETHNHPSAIEPYGGANTGLGGVIRDPLGTGLGAKPVCNSDVFCFAPPDTPFDALPKGVLHPKAVAQGVVAGVRDYGNRMGIPTVNGAVFFDERYLGNPLVYCGTAALLPVDRVEKQVAAGDYIVSVGGRTGLDGIHGATFSSIQLDDESETESAGAVQIGNAVAEKKMMDVILQARDRGLYRAITDCGAGGFSSAVGEMGEYSGAEVWLEKCPLKYPGLSYTEIWISEAQERMVLAVPPENWKEFEQICAAEGVEATVIGQFTDTQQLVLKYGSQQVGEVAMAFLHDGRPPVIREANYQPPEAAPFSGAPQSRYDDVLSAILASPNVCSKHWIIRQYDHEVQAGSVVKPLVGAGCDGPSDAAVVRPLLTSSRGLVLSNGMNPRYGDFDPYWMAASAIDEAVRNAVAVGADPSRIAILDNFCWGNTDRPETLGSLVRAALGCHDIAIAYGLPFISGKDSLNNEFAVKNAQGEVTSRVAIPPSLLISAMGQMEHVEQAVTMDLKRPENMIYLVGATHPEMGGSHFNLVTGATGGTVPQVKTALAPQIFKALHQAISQGLVSSCHDLSEGGLAVAAAEMAFAGGYGMELDLPLMMEATGLDIPEVLLFSESNTRFLVEVAPEQTRSFEALWQDLPCLPLGEVTAHDRLKVFGTDGNTLIDSSIRDLKAAWQGTLDWQ